MGTVHSEPWGRKFNKFVCSEMKHCLLANGQEDPGSQSKDVFQEQQYVPRFCPFHMSLEPSLVVTMTSFCSRDCQLKCLRG